MCILLHSSLCITVWVVLFFILARSNVKMKHKWLVLLNALLPYLAKANVTLTKYHANNSLYEWDVSQWKTDYIFFKNNSSSTAITPTIVAYFIKHARNVLYNQWVYYLHKDSNVGYVSVVVVCREVAVSPADLINYMLIF